MCINCLKITRNNRMTGNTNGEVAVLSTFIRNLLNDDVSFNKRHTNCVITTSTVPFNDIFFFFFLFSVFKVIQIKFKSILKCLALNKNTFARFLQRELRMKEEVHRNKES